MPEKADLTQFLTIREVARILRCSPDTIARHIAQGNLKGIEWIDPFGNGRLRASAESVTRFTQNRQAEMEKTLRARPS